MKKNSLRTAIVVLLSIALLVLIMRSFSPFGVKAIYNFTSPNKNWIKDVLGISSVNDLGTVNGEVKYLAVENDRASFSLQIPPSPKKVSTANISLSFKTDQEARIGIVNNQTQAVESIAFFEPNIQNLSWTSIEQGELSLYQKNEIYTDVNDFLSDSKITNSDGQGVGVFDYQLQPNINYPKTSMDNFQTNSILRGPHTFYVYVKNQPLKINISKIDLNQYVGEDEINIVGFQGDRSIFYTKIEDDGIQEKSLETGRIQTATIEKKLSNGVYKIVLYATIDSAITDLSINQGLVVFEDLFFADNPEVYSVAKEYKTNQAYTDSQIIELQLGHISQKQNVTINQDQFYIDEKSKTFEIGQGITDIASTVEFQNNLNTIKTQINDIRLSSRSVFSLTKEAFFKPFLSSTVDLDYTTDITELDYIIAKYHKATEENGWYYQDISIPLSFDMNNSTQLDFSIFSNDKKRATKNVWLKIKDLKITLE